MKRNGKQQALPLNEPGFAAKWQIGFFLIKQNSHADLQYFQYLTPTTKFEA